MLHQFLLVVHATTTRDDDGRLPLLRAGRYASQYLAPATLASSAIPLLLEHT